MKPTTNIISRNIGKEMVLNISNYSLEYNPFAKAVDGICVRLTTLYTIKDICDRHVSNILEESDKLNYGWDTK